MCGPPSATVIPQTGSIIADAAGASLAVAGAIASRLRAGAAAPIAAVDGPAARYVAGSAANLVLHPAQQNPYVVPSSRSVCGPPGATVMPQTGSIIAGAAFAGPIISRDALVGSIAGAIASRLRAGATFAACAARCFAGSAANFVLHPAQQNPYVVPSWTNVCGPPGATVMPQTGSTIAGAAIAGPIISRDALVGSIAGAAAGAIASRLRAGAGVPNATFAARAARCFAGSAANFVLQPPQQKPYVVPSWTNACGPPSATVMPQTGSITCAPIRSG